MGIQPINTDFSRLEGTVCYCSDEAAEQIRARIAGLPLGAVHLIGTGDCHYQSLFWMERIEEPFALVLFDNHPDDQEPAFGADILSCGSWVARARATLPLMRADYWLRDSRTAEIPRSLPLYLSIDIDVLSEEYARTHWSQGDMSLPELVAAVENLKSAHRIIGADICGGPGPEDCISANSRVYSELCRVLSSNTRDSMNT